MSQAGTISTSGGGTTPPNVATSYVTDVNSPAIPALNVLDVFGNTTSANNTNGIYTDGSSGSNVLSVFLTNRIIGSVSTADGTLTTIATFALPSAGVYTFDLNLAAYNSTDSTGASFSLFYGVKSISGTASVLNLADQIVNLEASMAACLVVIATSGNSMLVRVQGLAGKSISWNCVGTYVLAS